MGLVHQFAIIPEESNESIIKSSMESTSISDVIIQYIDDSLKWIYTTWNGKKLKKGISYYGFSIIEGGEIIKIKDIIMQWKLLFCLSPDNFYLTGEFLPVEGKYDENLIIKNEIVKELSSFIDLCEKAIAMDGKILHNGI